MIAFVPRLARLVFAAVWLAASVLAGASGVMAQDAQTGAGALPKVLDARVLSTPDRARLVVDLSGATQFAIAALDKPDRVVVDVRAQGLNADGIKASEHEALPDKGLIKSYALKQADKGRVRTELVLNAPVQVQQAYVVAAVDKQPARLVVDFIPDTAPRFAERVADDLAAAKAREQAADGPSATTQETAASPQDAAEARPLIVIDPGHGGVDSGARSADGLMEKNVTLSFAKELQRLLDKTGRFDVALTRNDDTFVRLEDRVQLARDNKADLFISVHADSFPDPSIRGASIYTRDETATDELDKVLAENENKKDLVAGYAPPKTDDHVVDILVDLMRRETRRQSFVAARDIEQQFATSIRVRRFPLRKADFFVLQAPDVPSILIELGFLSNEDDARNLKSTAWQDRTAAALARGIETYFDGLAAKK